ncbi:hypothetical protein L2E82_49992 [Cichorium intybus]|nr:hypothetical protein L2E82_49992 [Cichorium intybus]
MNTNITTPLDAISLDRSDRSSKFVNRFGCRRRWRSECSSGGLFAWPAGDVVAQTPFDFTTKKRIGDKINEVGLGYDHNYVLDCGEMEPEEMKWSVGLGL